ncbi:kinase-like domain-containing protein [Lactarius deliciosus]|nr:kinase-like domain-containing protein [Lactarius deliciosus]
MLNSKLQSRIQSLVHSGARSVEPAQCATGTPCLDDYEVLRTLGAGAHATVYLVREKHTSHLYALKAVDKYTASGRKVSSRMVLNEQATLTELNGNDFVLPLHACFHDTESFYLVTEYLPGGDLQHLQALKELDTEAIRFYMAELLLAIEHVHEHHIIHRDLKPENVFIDTDGHIVLGDFGIACQFASDTSPDAYFTHGRVGTPAFSSPEVLLEKDYGFEVDLWAFGVILYEMLSCREAFEVKTVPADDPTWLRHLTQRVERDDPVMFEGPYMTDDAADLVRKLLQKSPDARLSDITEIKQHAFFDTIDWTSVASRSLAPPWVPRLISTRVAGVHFEEPDVYVGELYDSVDDPLPGFTFRTPASSVSAASKRRQQIFGTLAGCAPLVSWVDGSSCAVACGETVSRVSERQGGLKSISRWARKALNRPGRLA